MCVVTTGMVSSGFEFKKVLFGATYLELSCANYYLLLLLIIQSSSKRSMFDSECFQFRDKECMAIKLHKMVRKKY